MASMLLLAACVTIYGRASATGGFGYSEYKIDDRTYQVRFAGIPPLTREQVELFWLYRCAYLAREKGYELFALAFPPAVRTDAFKSLPAASPALFLANTRERRNMYRHVELIRAFFVPGPRYWVSRGVMRVFHESLPADVPFAFRAQVIIDMLQPLVDAAHEAERKNDSGPYKGEDDEIDRRAASGKFSFTVTLPSCQSVLLQALVRNPAYIGVDPEGETAPLQNPPALEQKPSMPPAEPLESTPPSAASPARHSV